MKLTIQFKKKKKDPIRDLEQYFQNFSKGFKRQVSNLNVEGYFQTSRKQFYSFLNSAEKRIKKEEKKFLKQAWVKDIKKGKFLSKRANTIKYWYNENTPAMFKKADQGFVKVENSVGNTFIITRDWVGEKAPELGQQIKSNYTLLANRAAKSMKEYKKTLRKSGFKSKKQFQLPFAKSKSTGFFELI